MAAQRLSQHLESLADWVELALRASQAKTGGDDIPTSDRLLENIELDTEDDSPLPPSDARQQTSLHLIHQTPIELLVRIFHEASHPDGDFKSFDYVERLHVLAQVCSAWATIVRTTPSLWTLVQLDGTSLTEWTTALHRAKVSTIGVRFSTWEDDAVNQSLYYEPFWSAVVQHSARWRSLHVTADSGPILDFLETLEAPFLEELDLENISPNLHQMSQLFSDNLPHLTTFHLKGVAVTSWSLSIFAGLRELTLFCIFTSGPTVLQMLHILQACPALSTLTLGSVVFDDPTIAIEHSTVQLHSLQNITLEALDPVGEDALLQHLELSDHLDCAIFELQCDVDWTEAQLNTILSSLTPSTLHLFTTTKNMAIDCSTTAVCISTRDREDSMLFFVSYFPIRGNVLGGWLGRLIDSRALVPEVAPPEVILPLPVLEELSESLWGLSNVQKLDIDFKSMRKEEVDNFLEMMSGPTRGISGSLRWQCPGVRILALRQVKNLDAHRLLRILEHRVAVAGDSVEGAGLARLERFSIVGESSTLKLEAAELESGKAQLSVDDVIERTKRIIESGKKMDIGGW
ncbi:hypothetical protein FRB97_008629 [Tulasnella sp. 331]|nr:hypothetical protein FRB97_008629 [Tulasnella sp. 331]